MEWLAAFLGKIGTLRFAIIIRTQRSVGVDLSIQSHKTYKTTNSTDF